MIAPARVVGSLRRRHPACSSAGAGQQLRALLRLRLPRSQGSSVRDGLSCCICIATRCCATPSTQCSLIYTVAMQVVGCGQRNTIEYDWRIHRRGGWAGRQCACVGMPGGVGDRPVADHFRSIRVLYPGALHEWYVPLFRVLSSTHEWYVPLFRVLGSTADTLQRYLFDTH